MISHILNQSGIIYTQAINKYGDVQLSSGVTIACRFRYITDIDKGVNREALNSEAMIWLEPDTAVEEGYIVYVDSKYWRIEKLIKARKYSNEVEFLKAFVSSFKYGEDNFS